MLTRRIKPDFEISCFKSKPRAKKIHPKPKLIKIGDHFVDPNEVLGFKRANEELYILKLRSEPESIHPLWIKVEDMEKALKHFEVIK
jgi:hypothetical protein